MRTCVLQPPAPQPQKTLIHLLLSTQVHPAAARVTLCCSLSELAHAQQAGTELGVEAFTEYADALRQDLAQVGLG